MKKSDDTVIHGRCHSSSFVAESLAAVTIPPVLSPNLISGPVFALVFLRERKRFDIVNGETLRLFTVNTEPLADIRVENAKLTIRHAFR